MNSLVPFFWVGLGSAAGGMSRYWLSLKVDDSCRLFPLGTLIVNTLGSFLIGYILVAPSVTDLGEWEKPFRQFAAVGFCGGFTTFSTFSLQTLHLLQRNEFGQATANILVSLLTCLAAAYFGIRLGK